MRGNPTRLEREKRTRKYLLTTEVLSKGTNFTENYNINRRNPYCLGKKLQNKQNKKKNYKPSQKNLLC